jgi:hypothetical protein
MTPWEFSAALDGWARANGAGEKHERTYPTDEEFEDAIMRLH